MRIKLLQYRFVVIAIFLMSIIFGQSCVESQEFVVITGSERTGTYLPLLRGKSVAVVANNTSLIGKQHLVDSLLGLGVNLQKIFSPEHGFRGTAAAGEKVKSGVDTETGLHVVSLYGSHKKPTPGDLAGIEVVVFDIQDVGVRFYTYLSTLHYVMEACAENNIPVIVLDRPNPNAFYVDGPVLEPRFASFVGMHPVPVVYGMSIGEYARMVNGEGWLKSGTRCDLTVITCENWEHEKEYVLPQKPSPNLPNQTSIILYPSLCFFEGTVVSAGRGTDFPFQCYGHPKLTEAPFSYVPRSIPGVSRYPKFEGETCFGYDLRKGEAEKIRESRRLNLSYLIEAYKIMQEKGEKEFFNPFFKKLAGTDELQKKISMGWTEEKIRESWQEGLEKFRAVRKRYLLYPN